MKPKLGPNDIHIVTDGKSNREKVFDAHGTLLKTFDVFPHGSSGPRQDVNAGDTVAQLYLLGAPQWTGDHEDVETAKRPYGWVFIPMGDYEGLEAKYGRAGFGDHGGGHLADHWAARQVLTYTHGCVRHHNEDVAWLARKVEAVHKAGGKAWQTVTQ